MKKFYADFVTAYIQGNTVYDIYGSFNAVPNSDTLLPGEKVNYIKIHFVKNEFSDCFQEMPRYQDVYIIERDATFTIGFLKNQRIEVLSTPFYSYMKEYILEQYNIEATKIPG